MISRADLLKELPPFENKWELIASNQTVSDIVAQILNAHEQYRSYYDKIAKHFVASSTEDIAGNIVTFLEKNIAYKEEPESKQTTALPTAILTWGKGDCKHYASFSGGVLDAISRTTGKKINWCYRFVSYQPTQRTPHHVFVVIFLKDYEIWIDPTPGADKVTPVWILDKKVKSSTMPLYNIVSGTQENEPATVGWTLKEKLMHAGAKIPLLPGRAAFLQMLKLNVKAWAKNIQDAVNNKGNAASDPIGRAWYLAGGDAAPFWEAVREGSTKQMLGNTSAAVGAVDVVALIAAATPIVVAMTSVIKAAMNKPNFEQGQLLYPGQTPGTNTPYNPQPGTSTGIMDWIRQNPLPTAVAAGGLIYFLTQKKKRVTGTDNNTLLLLGGGVALYLLFRNKDDAGVMPPVTPVVETENMYIPPIEQPALPVEPPVDVIDYNGGSGGYGGGDVVELPAYRDSAYTEDYTGNAKHEYVDDTLLSSYQTV